jgi:hypothetical protein
LISSNEKSDNLISLQEASKLSNLSQVHLRHLVSTGKLWGKKIGRNWVTSKQAINNYLEEQKRPGRPPKKGL